MKKNFLITLLIPFLLFACKKEKETPQKENNSALIRSIVEEIILPEEEQFLSDVLLLEKKTELFTQNINETNLEQIRKQWSIVAKEWAKCYAFNIGDVKKEDFFIYAATFPSNTESLERKITETSLEELTAKFVLNRFGLDTKGIYGIEYLIFKEDKAKTVKSFSLDPKRVKVLELIVKEFVTDSKNNKKAWETFAPKLMANKEPEDSKDNSFALIFSGLDNVIHYAWETKIAKSIRKNDIEAPYSKLSLELIRENIAITKRVYFDGGIAALVEKKMKGNKSLNQSIRDRYTAIEKALNELQLPLAETVKDPTETAKLKKLLKEVKALEMIEFTHIETLFHLVDGTKEGDGD